MQDNTSLRILYTADSRIPSKDANSVHVMKMCHALADNGHNVTLTVPARSDRLSIDESVYQFYGVNNNFNLFYIPMIDIPKIRVIFQGLVIALLSYMYRVDLVYGRSMVGCYFASAMGHKVAFEEHTPSNTDGLSAMMYEQLMRSANLCALIVISESLKENFKKRYGFLNSNIIVAPDGADPLNGQSYNVFLTQNDCEIQIGYVGHLYEGKGMEIISKLVEECSCAYFHIIGGRDEDVEYWQEQFLHSENISFYGHHPHPHATAMLPHFDIVLAPYQRSVKGVDGDTDLSKWMSPLKIFEYMSAGNAIVCSDIPVLSEVLSHEKTALLVAPEQSDEWIEAIKTLAKDESKRYKLGKNAKEEFYGRYTWKQRANQIISELLDGGL